MVLETIIEIVKSISEVNSIILPIIFIIFIVLAYKIFQTMIKAFIVGVIAASFPVVAYFMGLDVPLTLESVVWFAIFGVGAYILYATISGGAKIAGFAMKPFGFLLSTLS